MVWSRRNDRLRRSAIAFGSLAMAAGVFSSASPARAVFVSSVQSFTQGTVTFANPAVTYNDSSAALGQPNRIVGASDGFPGPLTPFNPAYEQGEIVDVGLGGSITLKLASPVAVMAGQLQIGVFTSVGINDPTFGGQSETTARTFAGAEFGADRNALVEVASSLSDFKSLGHVTFANPSQAFSNQSDPYIAPGSPTNSDFDKPFAGTLASFNGKTESQISTLLNGSAGGNWLSVPGSAGLSEISYIRISDPQWVLLTGGSPTTDSIESAFIPGFFKAPDLFIDGVNVIQAIPEPATGLALIAVFAPLVTRRRQASR